MISGGGAVAIPRKTPRAKTRYPWLSGDLPPQALQVGTAAHGAVLPISRRLLDRSMVSMSSHSVTRRLVTEDFLGRGVGRGRAGLDRDVSASPRPSDANVKTSGQRCSCLSAPGDLRLAIWGGHSGGSVAVQLPATSPAGAVCWLWRRLRRALERCLRIRRPGSDLLWINQALEF